MNNSSSYTDIAYTQLKLNLYFSNNDSILIYMNKWHTGVNFFET